jgi:hypothetical protein
MADFLSSLETGITHTVGASSRLRNQIAIIDNYRHLSAQRQPDFASTPYTPSVPAPAPHPHPPRPFRLKQEPNPNIDPSLQNAGLPTGGSAAAGFIENVYGFVPQSVGLNGNEIGVVAGEERFQMRVPPELEGFPLGFDIGQRLGQIPS